MKRLFLSLPYLLLVINTCNAEKIVTEDIIQLQEMANTYAANGKIADFEQLIHGIKASKKDYMHSFKAIQTSIQRQKEKLKAALVKEKEEEKRLKEEWTKMRLGRYFGAGMTFISLVGAIAKNKRNAGINVLIVLTLGALTTKIHYGCKDSEEKLESVRDTIEKHSKTVENLDIMFAYIQKIILLEL